MKNQTNKQETPQNQPKLNANNKTRRGGRKLVGVMGVSVTLPVVMGSQVCVHLQTHQIGHNVKQASFLTYISYGSRAQTS